MCIYAYTHVLTVKEAEVKNVHSGERHETEYEYKCITVSMYVYVCVCACAFAVVQENRDHKRGSDYCCCNKLSNTFAFAVSPPPPPTPRIQCCSLSADEQQDLFFKKWPAPFQHWLGGAGGSLMNTTHGEVLLNLLHQPTPSEWTYVKTTILCSWCRSTFAYFLFFLWGGVFLFCFTIIRGGRCSQCSQALGVPPAVKHITQHHRKPSLFSFQA